jgi:hypothetical protein
MSGTVQKDYWCIVALDYHADEAFVLKVSDDAIADDVVDASTTCDFVDNDAHWRAKGIPGLYKLNLRFSGGYNSCVTEVESAELMMVFPKLIKS